MNAPLLVFVGGFLGAGKTTLILDAARRLRREGVRAAVIMNDQDGALVDSRLAEAQHVDASEVAGGCFCCRFSDLLAAAEALETFEPAIIFAEPVGSCIDLSATILHPLKTLYAGRYRLAPLTVLVDPGFVLRDPDVDYLYRNQIAEADLICTSKADLAIAPALPFPVDFALSGLTGQGVAAWLDEVRHSTRIAGAHLLDVDYQRYADAEAALGWLNFHADLELREPASPASVVGPLLDDLDRLVPGIAHLKIFDQCASGYVKASLCANGSEPWPTGDLAASPETHHELVVNLRALADPGQMTAALQTALAAVTGKIHERHFRAFRPLPPTPEHHALSS